MITMRKIGMIFLSVIVVVSLAACDSGDGKTKKVTEEQTESVKPTEKATESVKSTEEVAETTVSIQEEAATEIVTGAVSQKDNKKRLILRSSRDLMKNTADSSNKQNNNSAGTRQEAANTDNSDNSNAGDDNGTANAPADSEKCRTG